MNSQPDKLSPKRKRRARNRQLSVVAGITLAVSALSPAVHAHDRYNGHRHGAHHHRAFGRVIDVRPVYRHVVVREPHRQCSPRGIRSGQRHSRNAAPVIGGIVGGVIGNSLARGRNDARSQGRHPGRNEGRNVARNQGRGNSRGNNRRHVDPGRVGATVAGAILGAAIGSQFSQGHGHRGGRCVDVYENRRERQLDHYKVTYIYQGRRFTTTTQHNPGRRIEVQRHARRR